MKDQIKGKKNEREREIGSSGKNKGRRYDNKGREGIQGKK